jgi:hypothetical protein
MNTFDFYMFTIKLGTSYKRKIKQLGIDPKMVQSEKHYVRVGYNVYPRWTYSATVGFMDAITANYEKVNAYCKELEAQYHTHVHPSYIVRD